MATAAGVKNFTVKTSGTPAGDHGKEKIREGEFLSQLSRPELNSMQLSDLKGVCKQRKVSATGSKSDSVERILANVVKGSGMELDDLTYLLKINEPSGHDGTQVFAVSVFPPSADAYEILVLIKEYVSDLLHEFALEVCGIASEEGVQAVGVRYNLSDVATLDAKLNEVRNSFNYRGVTINFMTVENNVIFVFPVSRLANMSTPERLKELDRTKTMCARCFGRQRILKFSFIFGSATTFAFS